MFLFEVLDFRGLFRNDRIAVDKIPRWTLIYFDHKALPMLIASFLRLYTNLVLLLGLDLDLQTISHDIIAKLVHENWNSIQFPKGIVEHRIYVTCIARLMDQAVVLSEPPSPLVRGSEVQRGSNMLEPLGTLFKPPTDLFWTSKRFSFAGIWDNLNVECYDLYG